jgi:hypothetical protein
MPFIQQDHYINYPTFLTLTTATITTAPAAIATAPAAITTGPSYITQIIL